MLQFFAVILFASILACVRGGNHSVKCYNLAKQNASSTTNATEICPVFLECCDEKCPNGTEEKESYCDKKTSGRGLNYTCSCVKYTDMDYTMKCLAGDTTSICKKFLECCTKGGCETANIICAHSSQVIDENSSQCSCNGSSRTEQCLAKTRPKSCHEFIDCCQKKCPKVINLSCNDHQGYIDTTNVTCGCKKSDEELAMY